MTAPLPIDRRYLSRYAAEQVGFVAMIAGQPGDVDANAVTATLLDATTLATIRTAAAAHLATGRYGLTLTSADTSTPRLLDLRFNFAVGGSAGIYVVELQVGPSAPDYDVLEPSWRAIVEAVWVRFADLFDSPLGGPNLQVYVQTRFGRNRMSQLLRQAVGRLNTISQPHQAYAVNEDFPFDQWGPLVEQALYVEVVKHLIRSYVEQPDVVLTTAISRLDRRDYMQRWQEVLATEQEDLRAQLDSFKIASLGLGHAKVLVSGGVYGRYLGYYTPGAGQALARGYFPAAIVG